MPTFKSIEKKFDPYEIKNGYNITAKDVRFLINTVKRLRQKLKWMDNELKTLCYNNDTKLLELKRLRKENTKVKEELNDQ